MRGETVAYLLGASSLAMAATAWGCYWKSRFHDAKAEVYQEFADTYSGMVMSGLFGIDKKKRKAESKRHHMRLALVDPLIRDGLVAAVEEAEEKWARSPHRDEPRTWRIVRDAP